MSVIKTRVYTLLEPGEKSDWASKSVDLALILLIIANVFAAILETIPEIHGRFGGEFLWFETISIGIFSVEYILRLWSCTATGISPVWGRVRFFLRPMLLIDLIVILPFLLQFFGFGMDLRMGRLVRVARFIRIARLGRYSTALHFLWQGVREKKEEFSMTLMLGVFSLLLASTFIFYAENESQPEVFSSIPASFWWAITTLTTVGYGDAYPVTTLGKIFGGVFQIIGVMLIALPTGVMTASFFEQIERSKTASRPSPQFCPHCGESLGEK